MLEKTLESPLDCKEIQPVHPKGDQSWCSLEGLMLKLKLQYFGHLMWKVDSLEKTRMLGGIGGRRGRGTTEDEMAGWHHWLDGRESEWTPGVGDGQGGLVCCDSWGGKESDMTERLNSTILNWTMWKCWVLTTGPPGNYQIFFFFCKTKQGSGLSMNCNISDVIKVELRVWVVRMIRISKKFESLSIWNCIFLLQKLITLLISRS